MTQTVPSRGFGIAHDHASEPKANGVPERTDGRAGLLKRAFLFFLVVFSGAGLVLACSSPEKFIGGGRNFEPGAPVQLDSGTGPQDTGAEAAPDIFVPPDTGPKDTGGGS